MVDSEGRFETVGPVGLAVFFDRLEGAVTVPVGFESRQAHVFRFFHTGDVHTFEKTVQLT